MRATAGTTRSTHDVLGNSILSHFFLHDILVQKIFCSNGETWLWKTYFSVCFQPFFGAHVVVSGVFRLVSGWVATVDDILISFSLRTDTYSYVPFCVTRFERDWLETFRVNPKPKNLFVTSSSLQLALSLSLERERERACTTVMSVDALFFRT